MLKGLNDVVEIKSKVQTSDNRGGVTTTLTTKIAALTCSIQPVRREEIHFDESGQIVIDPTLLVYDNITTGPDVTMGDIVSFNNDDFLVITCAKMSGLGSHTECVLRVISNDTYAH